MHKIFICGLDRSGTTFLASILASVRNSHVVSETPFKFEDLSESKSRRIIEKNHVKYFQEFGFDSYEEARSSLCTKNFLKVLREGIEVVIDHTPKNRYFVPELINTFSDASIIFIFRNDFDVYLSHKNVSWGDRNLCSIILRRYQTTLQFYASKIRYGSLISRVNYEDLIEGNVGVLEEHLSTHNLQHNPLKAQAIPVAAFSKKQHLLVGQDADKTKVNKPAKSKTEMKLKSIYNFSPFAALIYSFYIEVSFGEVIKKLISRLS